MRRVSWKGPGNRRDISRVANTRWSASTGTTEHERNRLIKANYNAGGLNPKKPTDRSLFWKMNVGNPGASDDIKPRFELHPDTAFMLGAPRFALPVPEPAPEYLKVAEDESSTRLLAGQPILLILDLNGTLLYRPNKKLSHSFIRRKRLHGFLQYVFETFRIMIWTTAQPGNAKLMVHNMLSGQQKERLVDTWDRRSFHLSAHQYNTKTVAYKRLEWIWENEAIQSCHPWYSQGGRWSQVNTILLDDSTVKATAQPYNHILVPDFSGGASDANVKCGAVLEQVAGYLEVVRTQSNVSAYMKINPFKVDETGYFMALGPQARARKETPKAQQQERDANAKQEVFS